LIILPIPNPRDQKDAGFRITDPGPQHWGSTVKIEKNPECTPRHFLTDAVRRRRSGLPPSWRRRSLTGSGLREMRRTTSVRGSGSSA